MSTKEMRYCIYRRARSPYWWIRRTVPGIGEIRLSTRTRKRAQAEKFDYLVVELREAGRFDALSALKDGRVSLQELDTHRDPARLRELLTRTESPCLFPLLDEWLAVGAADRGIRDSSMRRYAGSWKHVRELLSPASRLSAIDQSFITAFKRHRRDGHRQVSAATLNRDLAAIGAFLTWCAEEKELTVERPKLKYHKESRGRVRSLSIEEMASFREHCSPDWWPLFALLCATGITISEALGLRVSDVDLKLGRLSIHESHGRKLKRESRARELAIPASIIPVLAAHAQRATNGPLDRLFPTTYKSARKAWVATCRAAEIVGARIHDTRHTFAVHAVSSGVPESRLQNLLGHSHAGTTRRYASFAKGSLIKEDGEAVAKSLGLEGAHLKLERQA